MGNNILLKRFLDSRYRSQSRNSSVLRQSIQQRRSHSDDVLHFPPSVHLLPWIKFSTRSSCCANYYNSSGWESLLFIARNNKKYNIAHHQHEHKSQSTTATPNIKFHRPETSHSISLFHLLIPVECPPIFPLSQIEIRGRAISHLISTLFPGPSLRCPWNYVPVTQLRCSDLTTTTRDASESVRCCSAYAANTSVSSVVPSADWHSRRNAGTFPHSSGCGAVVVEVVFARPGEHYDGLRVLRSTVYHPAQRLCRQCKEGLGRGCNRSNACERSDPWRASQVRRSAIGRHISRIGEWRRFWKDE